LVFLDGKPTGSTANENTGEKLFGPNYESSSKNVTMDHQKPYRALDTRRDEAVNTVESTFRRLKTIFCLYYNLLIL
jgi:hypothetical protein